jgi:hypothetical protein
MTGWRRFVVAGVGALSLVGAGSVSVAAHEGGDLIEFDSMTPVTGAAVGTVNDRGLKGGGLPWMIASGSGDVSRRGHVEVEVTGLVLAAGANIGKNPIPTFAATVSCLTPHGVVNVTTASFPATVPGGDSTINARVRLPHPCKSPEVFVGTVNATTGAFAWFAQSNAENDEDDD